MGTDRGPFYLEQIKKSDGRGIPDDVTTCEPHGYRRWLPRTPGAGGRVERRLEGKKERIAKVWQS